MLGKIVKKESRGTLFGTFSLIGSLGVIFVNKLGGYLFDTYSIMWPFRISFIAYSCFVVILVAFAMCK